MTTVSERPKVLTIDEYLERESYAPAKHHYENGTIIPMADGTTDHNLIAANLVTAINNAVRKTGILQRASGYHNQPRINC